MFVDSSKVLIIESNVAKDAAGPTVGSIGYVIPHCETFEYVVNELKDYISSGNPVETVQKYFDNNTKNETVGYYDTSDMIYIFKEMHVLFTQFGKEGKCKKCEKKPVINVFPFPKKDAAVKKLEKTKIITGELVDRVYHYADNKLNKESLKSVPTVCVMIPYYTEHPADLTKDDIEFEGWARSVLQNGLLNLYSNTTTQANIFTQMPLINRIRDYVVNNDRPPRISTIMEWAGMDRKEVINNLRLLHITLVNNYDMMAHRHAARNNFPTRLHEGDSLNKYLALGGHCWRIGFNSNRQKINPHNRNMIKYVSLVAKAQQQLLSKGL